MTIKIEMLRCFYMVARHGNLSVAADELGRTPSAVSMMLKQFEEHIGSPLFETARKSRLTAIGELIFEEARREVTHFEKTVSVIEGLAKSEQGYLRLAVTPSVATAVLPEVISSYIHSFPNVQIDIRDMDSASISRELLRDRADIGVGAIQALEAMPSAELFRDRFGVLCRKDHPLAQNWNELTWADMHDHVLIANGLCDQISDPDFVEILAKSRLMVRNTASLLGLVRQGVGITVLPQLAMTTSPSDLVFLPLVDVTAQSVVRVVSHPKEAMLPAAREFVNLLTKMSMNGSIKALSKIQ